VIVKNLTQDRLKEMLCYNDVTGVFTWRISIGRVSAGSVAGRIVANRYRIIKIDKNNYLAHRLAFLYITGSMPKNEVDHIDHIDHDRDNNCFKNLRDVTRSENAKNMSIPSNNVSGITGVSWHRLKEMWRSQITSDRKIIHLGLFLDKWDVICSRKSAEYRYCFHENHGS